MLPCGCDGLVAVGFAARWKEGFMSRLNRNFARLLMMGVLSWIRSGDVALYERLSSGGLWWAM
jgi:hypothetical protein